MNSASPDARESCFGGTGVWAGSSRGARELPGRARECAGLLALERERPGGEDAGALAGGVGDRGGVGAGGAELLADALQLHRAAVPHQPALLELGMALGRRRAAPPGSTSSTRGPPVAVPRRLGASYDAAPGGSGPARGGRRRTTRSAAARARGPGSRTE